MGRRDSNQSVEQAVERARFAVRDLTRSKVQSDFRAADEIRAGRLRDIGWHERADEIEERSAQRWGR